MNDFEKNPLELRVLALAPSADDVKEHCSVLGDAGLKCDFLGDPTDLSQELAQGAGAILLTEEFLVDDKADWLADILVRQPPWSDIPVVLIVDADARSGAAAWGLETPANITILQRPVHAVTLVSSLRAAIRGRRRQYALRDRFDAQALLAAVVESSQDAIISKTLDGIITSWNSGAERLFEYSAAEAVGRSILFLIPEERHSEEQMILERLRRGERIEHFETERVTKSGRTLDISLTISPIIDSSGHIVGASKVARDITAQKHAQETLRHSEQRFRFLAEMLPSIVWTAAPDGKITYVNQRWLQYCGLTAEQNSKDWPEMVLHPEDRERCLSQWIQALREGKPYEIEVRNRRHDGVYRWFMTRAVPLKDQAGQLLVWFGLTTDIHDQKELQEKLREADRRKDAFLATLAHELRNPLAPIRNGLYLLRQVRENAAEFDDTRRMMETQLRHMVRLLDDLLDISRIARNKIQLRKERVELAWVVNDAVEATRPLIDERGHQLSVELPPEPVCLDADPVRLAQVLSNLLNNAAKYTDPGGRVSLSATRRPAPGPNGSTEIVIHVRDTGLGISKEMMPRIFGLFFQADDHASYSAGGLGIGLSLVKNLVEMHGGRVEAHSEGPGRGSDFVVRLPAPDDQQVEPAPTPLASGPGASQRILVVDDNRAAADTMAKILSFFGHEVRVAYDGQQALAFAQEFHPDAALLDIGLPGVDGNELARRLRGRPGGENLVLIALTGFGREEDRQRSLAAGFDAHLVKPVKMGTICDILAGRLQLSAAPSQPQGLPKGGT